MGGRGAHYLSVGIQGGLVQKSVDYTNLVFESMMIGQNGVDPNLPSGEYGSDAFSISTSMLVSTGVHALKTILPFVRGCLPPFG